MGTRVPHLLQQELPHSQTAAARLSAHAHRHVPANEARLLGYRPIESTALLPEYGKV